MACDHLFIIMVVNACNMKELELDAKPLVHDRASRKCSRSIESKLDTNRSTMMQSTVRLIRVNHSSLESLHNIHSDTSHFRTGKLVRPCSSSDKLALSAFSHPVNKVYSINQENCYMSLYLIL